ncbi:MAG: sigma-70 family RNA polymerase sigma factor [Ferruginibacter sp.]
MKQGNEAAFLNIYHEHYNVLFAYGFSLTCDKELTKDCIQEMFLELWTTRTSVTKEVHNIRSYLFTWLRRKISRTQSRSIKEKSGERSSEGFEQNESSYEEILIAFHESEEKKEKISRALRHLTKKQLEIIRLKFFENLSYDEIAVKTALTTRTVYNHIYLAVQKLREEMNLAHVFNLFLLVLSLYYYL